jgi:hypothetical protein
VEREREREREMNGPSLSLFTDLPLSSLSFISNAIKFTKKGEIVIRMECERVRGSIGVRGAGGAGGGVGGGIRLSVSIQDSGFGMSKEQQKNLFEKFTQVGINRFSTYGGSGLGLLISKNLALLMDGDLRVESELGKGSTFSLTMTCEEGENCERRNSWDEKFFSIGGLPLAKTPLVALIVEDNPVNAKVLSWMLCKKGR